MAVTAGTVTAAAYLVTELMLSGMEIAVLLQEMKATGKLSDEQWQKIIDDLDSAKADWDNA